MTGPLQFADQHLVADDVELLLDLSLHVLDVGAAEGADECALAHLVADDLHRGGESVYQSREVSGGVVVEMLLLDRVAGESGAAIHDGDALPVE